jgi:hypothetical protein
MNIKMMQEQYREILTNINKKYELKFEEYFFKKNSYLFGIIGTRAIWIYLHDGEIILEETFHLKGARYKRGQGKEIIKITEEKVKEIDDKVRLFLYQVKEKERIESFKNMFKSDEKTPFNLFNHNMVNFLMIIYKIKTKTLTKTSDKFVIEEIEKLFKETKYKTFKEYAPLLQGIEFHRKYNIGTNAETGLMKKISFIKNASKKIIFYDKDLDKVIDFESEKDLLNKYVEKNSLVIN